MLNASVFPMICRCFLIASSFTVLFDGRSLANEVQSVQPGRVVRVRSQSEDLPAPVVTAVAIRGGGDLLAVGGDDHLIRIWHLPSGRLLHTLKAHTDWVHTVAFSPDRSALITAGADGRVLTWSLASLHPPQELVRWPTAISRIHFVRDGAAVMVAGFDSTMEMFDVATGQRIQSFDCPCRDIRSIAVSSDDQLIAAAGRNGIIRLWSLVSGNKIWDLNAHRLRIRDLAFSTDATQLISASEDRLVCVWNVKTAGLDQALPRQRAKVLAILPLEGDRLVIAGSDNTIGIWDISSGEQLQELIGHTGSVSALAREGTTLVSGSFDTTVGVWDLSRPLHVPTQRGRQVAGGDLAQ